MTNYLLSTKRIAFSACLVLAMLASIVWLYQPASVHASWQGRPLFSGNPSINGGENCTQCHGPDDGEDPITDVTLSVTGPATVNSGDTNLYTAVLSGGPGAVGGLGLSVGNLEGTLTPVNDILQNASGELTHKIPQAFAEDGTLSFTFEWTAPDYGASLVMHAAGVSGNNSETPLGDGVGTSALTITVNGPDATPTPMPTTSPADAIVLETIASGLSNPVDIQNVGDERLFIVEQPGLIQIIDSNGDQLGVPFLDIEGRVDDGANEMGLLGMAFHPNYASNGYFYLNYTVGSPRRTRIARFQVSDDPNVADAASETILLEFDQPNANHNGGQVQFGPDGYLYIATGDGGGGGDPDLTGQDNGTLLGKILRIDVDQSSEHGPDCQGDAVTEVHYSVPADNPFRDGADGRCDEIWATGLRNPWRFSFDALTNDMWIGDVGQSQTEEINFQPAASTGGENYGWRCFEGNDVYADDTYYQDTCNDGTTYTAPIYPYDRSNGACSVTGGIVYRGGDYPGLAGQYIFVDYCRADLWSLRGDANQGSVTFTELNIENNRNLRSPTTFGVDYRNELYVASRSGTIYQIKTSGPAATPTSTPTPTQQPAETSTPTATLTATPTPTPTAGGSTGIPSVLTIDHRDGAPGSEFTFRAINLEPNFSGIITVNGTSVGTGQADEAGELTFVLTTQDLSSGLYLVSVSGSGQTLTSQFSLEPESPNRTSEANSAASFAIPTTITPASGLLVPLILFQD